MVEAGRPCGDARWNSTVADVEDDEKEPRLDGSCRSDDLGEEMRSRLYRRLARRPPIASAGRIIGWARCLVVMSVCSFEARRNGFPRVTRVDEFVHASNEGGRSSI